MTPDIADLIGKTFYWREECEETGVDQSGYYTVQMADKDNCWCYLQTAEMDVEIELPTDWVIQMTDPDDNWQDWSE